MKKIYTSLTIKASLCILFSLTLGSNSVFAQSLCGNIVQDFNNTGGSTAGFTGNFSFANSGPNGYLQKANVTATTIYSITTATYTLPANAQSIGYGFTLDGTEKVARAEVKIQFKSTITGLIETKFVEQMVPNYGNGNQPADVCRAVSLTELPGFPTGGNYRFIFEFTTNSGTGAASQTLRFDDFRTNGTLSQIPLPVTFIGFEAKKANSTVQLTWKVAGENNVVRYEIEKSDDGRNFATVGAIQSSGASTYTYNDPINNGTAFYRIKNVDNDGKFKYSTIVRITNGKSEIVLTAFPQPVLSQLTLQHPVTSVDALIRLSTVDGRIVRTIKPSNGSMQTSVDMSSLQPGLYLLHFNGGDGNAQTLKVVKQ